MPCSSVTWPPDDISPCRFDPVIVLQCDPLAAREGLQPFEHITGIALHGRELRQRLAFGLDDVLYRESVVFQRAFDCGWLSDRDRARVDTAGQTLTSRRTGCETLRPAGAVWTFPYGTPR